MKTIKLLKFVGMLSLLLILFYAMVTALIYRETQKNMFLKSYFIEYAEMIGTWHLDSFRHILTDDLIASLEHEDNSTLLTALSDRLGKLEACEEPNFVRAEVHFSTDARKVDTVIFSAQCHFEKGHAGLSIAFVEHEGEQYVHLFRLNSITTT
ncbi:hypothetical protein [Thaumasiovibrio subtropicus]|uniref:hypothetical protein n=1 Tax=Thaumasiovibrio subtropicus TaxID=1891207 RepID=UPI000B35D349|nr:hypothetical protein [Thaumasiovibrio subtropicus]